ncbi:hypothetical protein ACW5R3_11475 [Bizionia sp. KMM 8389]
MKKLLVIALALVGMQLSAQNLSSLGSAAVSSQSSSMINQLAGDQVMKLTKKLNLSDSQQKMATDLVVTQLKSDKFQKFIGDSASKLMGSGSSGSSSDAISKALLNEPEFQKGMTEVLDEKQEQEFNKLIPRS